MKKLPFLLIVFTVWFSSSAQAQIIKSIGFRAGFTTTFPEIKELQDGQPVNDEIYNRKMLYPEFQAELFLRNHLSLLANLAYISKGFNYWDSWAGSFVSGSGS